MCIEYYCDACCLRFSIGWGTNRPGQYCASTDLVCKECGTWHKVDHAYNRDIPDRLRAQSCPLFRKVKHRKYNNETAWWFFLGNLLRWLKKQGWVIQPRNPTKDGFLE